MDSLSGRASKPIGRETLIASDVLSGLAAEPSIVNSNQAKRPKRFTHFRAAH